MYRWLLRRRTQLKKCLINGREAGIEQVSALIAAFNSREVRTEKGGYLFRAASDADSLYIGVLPCLFEGERSYHYNIRLPEELQRIIIGGLTPDGVFSLLFQPEARPMAPQEMQDYRVILSDLTSFLTENGLVADAPADNVTLMLLKSSGVLPQVPDNATIAIIKTMTDQYRENHN